MLKLGDHPDPNWRPNSEDFKSADVFALGLVIFYVMSGGYNSFSNPKRPNRVVEIESRVADGKKPDMKSVEDHVYSCTVVILVPQVL